MRALARGERSIFVVPRISLIEQTICDQTHYLPASPGRQSLARGMLGGPSFAVMRCLLIASQGEPLTATELATFTAVTGGYKTLAIRGGVLDHRGAQAWQIARRGRPGRLSGRVHRLSWRAGRGERGVLPIMAASTSRQRRFSIS